LKPIDQNIKDAASGGKCSTKIFLGAVETFRHLDMVVTPLQKDVVERLKYLGYHAVIKVDGEFYVPKGLADDEAREEFVFQVGAELVDYIKRG